MDREFPTLGTISNKNRKNFACCICQPNVTALWMQYVQQGTRRPDTLFLNLYNFITSYTAKALKHLPSPKRFHLMRKISPQRKKKNIARLAIILYIPLISYQTFVVCEGRYPAASGVVWHIRLWFVKPESPTRAPVESWLLYLQLSFPPISLGR